MTMSLETPHLSLRLSRASDLDDLFALEQDPEVMRFLNGGHPTAREGIDEEADYLMPRGGEDGLWVAHERSSGAFVGWFALMSEENGIAELGYRLARSMWGRGFASEGATALIDLGFSRLGYRRIFAGTMAVNRASRRVMEKAGLTYVRTVNFNRPDPLPGNEQGDVEYALTREAWQSARRDEQR
jgi:RimJ/RimL family protein N-acetyltransferase